VAVWIARLAKNDWNYNFAFVWESGRFEWRRIWAFAGAEKMDCFDSGMVAFVTELLSGWFEGAERFAVERIIDLREIHHWAIVNG
jgi:hypothetical protein